MSHYQMYHPYIFVTFLRTKAKNPCISILMCYCVLQFLAQKKTQLATFKAPCYNKNILFFTVASPNRDL